MTPTAFLDHSLLLDLETRGSEAILRIGAVLRNLSFERKGSFPVERALTELDALARSARWVLGHNLLDHDLRLIRQLAPALDLLRKPVIDTLVLSPLAFPENPYHRLVKDYRLVSGSVNDPVADARLAGQLFRDQLQSFTRLAARERELLAFYAFCLQPSGAADVLETLAGRPALSHPEAAAFFIQSNAPFACRRALAARTEAGLADPAAHPAWAYAAAWLRVSGANSVLPPWVWHRHPAVRTLLHALRELPCDDPACSYCRSTHDPAAQLERFFGFREFRPEPKDDAGTSLQEAIIRTSLAGEPHLAILATGAGKSICYQLPALVRYFRRGSLTLVISPLQALMRDQVSNLNARTGTDCAAALYGLLTPPERGAVHERVRLGDVALLYVSPEQLRNRSLRSTLEQREIDCWVFDEAHCLSKWGHDFRPDYLYAARFIRQLAQRQGSAAPPIAAFTATAKLDVEREIVEHFERELGQRLRVFSSSVERPELRFRVEATLPAEKLERIATFLHEALAGPSGSAVVYFASRRGSERAARALEQMGFPVGVFHAGLKTAQKREVLDAFLSGALRVVCATNAFGMGIDKDDVRLVIHAEIPGSLESYLQEAGRAGRDRLPSSCVLLFDETDVEKQFRLSASSRLSQRDVVDLLRALRRARKNREGELVVTTGELLHDDTLGPGLEADDPFADTKVRTGVAWLERAGFIERGENHTRVFQGRLKVTSLEQARGRIAGLNLSDRDREQWLAVVAALIAADPDRGLTADELAELPALGWAETSGAEDETPGERVLRLLHRMAEAGLLREGLVLTAALRARGRGNALAAFEALCGLERAMLEELRAAEPDAEPAEESEGGGWLELSLRLLNQRLLDRGLKSHPETLRRLLASLARAGKSRAGRTGSFELAYRSRGYYRLRLLASWGEIFALAELRRAPGRVLLEMLVARAPVQTETLATVEFSSDELTAALRSDLVLGTQLRDPLAAAERALLFLHEQGVIHLQGGLAVFRQAMGLRLLPEARGRRYGRSDYAPLDEHYGERTLQVHVMARYAHLGLEQIRAALALVEDYFQLARKAFLRRYFAGEEAEVARATGPESYRRIVDELANPAQIALVTAAPERNLLVLAGPGSGKTRVVVHRAAYLLRVARVSPRSLLILCFNRNAALELRRRLAELVGEDARGVTVLTYHGLAMRLTGTSFATLLEPGEHKIPDFDKLIPAAVKLLTSKEEEAPGLEAEELRERLLAGYSHLLVDEYQDVNQPQYELLSAIAGRTREEGEGKLQILAVGDDDQNVYTFTGAHVRYLRQFQDDYQAEVHLLVENYRSTAHVIACANQLIAHNRERMKVDAPIVVDAARRDEAPGEPVEVLEVAGAACQAAVVVARLELLREHDPGLSWGRCAVLGRKHKCLEPVRALLEQAGIPVSLAPRSSSLPPLGRLREIARFLDRLRAEHRELRRASELEALRAQLASGAAANPWWRLLEEILAELRIETNDARQPVAMALEFVHDALAERARRAIVGEGVRLLTAHAAKGLEFDHVLVLDGRWELRSGQGLDEERRLFYVAMTRARKTLCLFERAHGRNPHVALLAGDFLRRCRPVVDVPPAEIVGRRFRILGLKGLYLSYAGYFGPSHPIHRRLARLEPGDALELLAGEGRLRLADRSGGVVAALSDGASGVWRGRLGEVVSARVLGVIEQRAETASSEYRERAQQPSWEVPMVELVWLRAPTSRPIRV